jgi:hypothetical protein
MYICRPEKKIQSVKSAPNNYSVCEKQIALPWWWSWSPKRWSLLIIWRGCLPENTLSKAEYHCYPTFISDFIGTIRDTWHNINVCPYVNLYLGRRKETKYKKKYELLHIAISSTSIVLNTDISMQDLGLCMRRTCILRVTSHLWFMPSARSSLGAWSKPQINTFESKPRNFKHKH